MDGKTLIHIQRKNKDICILLREGEILSLENIVDVWVSDQPERSKREDPKCCERIYMEYAPEWGIPSGYYNLKPDGMRCSEHGGNIVREVQ